jgi:hypothetical protein
VPNSYVLLHIIEGFRQDPEGWWNGCHELREFFRKEFDHYSRCTLDIKLSQWDSDFEKSVQDLVEIRKRYKVPRERFAIGLFPFSWGVGHGVPAYGKQLKRYGFQANVCVPCDGVYYRDDVLLGFLGSWTGILGDDRIKFPDNVLHTIPFFQKQDIPHGRGIATTQSMEQAIELPYIHTQMDDAPEWHLKCVEAAHQLIREFLPSKDAPSTAPTVAKTIEKLEESKLAHEVEGEDK